MKADATLEMEQRDFIRAGLEYVCLIQEVQERKKFEFVETLLGFMYGWLTFYHHGHEVAKDYKPHMTELQTRIQKVYMEGVKNILYGEWFAGLLTVFNCHQIYKYINLHLY
mgnify:CR=1 FL=1